MNAKEAKETLTALKWSDTEIYSLLRLSEQTTDMLAYYRGNDMVDTYIANTERYRQLVRTKLEAINRINQIRDEQQRWLLSMKYIGGLDDATIAKRMAVSAGELNKRHADALEALAG